MKYLAVLLLCGAVVGQKDEKLTYTPHKVVPALESDMVWKDSPGTMPLTCKVNSSGMGFDCHVLVEKADVPAIQEIGANSPVGACAKGKKDDIGQYYCAQPSWTCADKERILERSESGKYWCRKVQN